MSVMSNLAIDLGNMIGEGYSNSVIAEELGVSVDIVAQFREEVYQNHDYGYDESMDGDFDSALASAGFGTDEDYGYHGEE